jgi:ribosome-associated protein
MTSVNPANPVNATPVAASTFDVRAVAIEIARLLSDDKCSDITLLDVRGISSVQDYVIIASGTSDRQMRSAATDVKNMLPKLGSSVYRTSIDDQSTWIVVDCVDTVIHIFEPNTRSYYDLESMWGDAPKLEWLRPGQKPYTPEDYSNAVPDESEPGDSDEPVAKPVEASEPDADLELTTGSAESFVEDVRASVSKPAPKSKKPAAKKAAPAKKAKAAPAKKPAAKAKPKPAAKKVAKKAAPKLKKAPAAKKPAAKPAKKAAAKPVKKAAKPAKKTAKKKGR